MPVDAQIDARLVELQIAQDYPIQELRQTRVDKADLASGGVELQTQRSFDQGEGCRARPGLRRARHRIVRRAAAAASLEAAEQFRQPAELHVGGRVEQTLEYALDGMLEAIACESKRNQCVVVRPDRAVVIGHRIIAGLV